MERKLKEVGRKSGKVVVLGGGEGRIYNWACWKRGKIRKGEIKAK